VSALPRVSGDTLAVALAAAAAAAVSALFGTVAADARWLAALGRYIVDHGSIPGFVPYAAAPSSGWHDAPALGQIVFHGLEALGGDRALLVVQVLVVAAAFALIGHDTTASGAPGGASLLVSLLLIPAAFVSLPLVRVQVFSLLLFPLLALLLRSEARRPSRRIWLVPPLLALWANLHGAVLVGLGVTVIYFVVDRLRRQPWTALAGCALSVVAVFATPSLWDTGSYYAGVLGNEAARRGVGQWAPLSPGSGLDLTFLVCAVLLALLAYRGRPTAWEVVALVALAVLAGRTARGGVWFAFLAAAPAARGLRRQRAPRPQVAAPLLLVLAAIAVIGLVRGPHASGADRPLLRRALDRAAGTPILATELLGEQVALAGGRVWLGNPIDAFRRRDQRVYLDWLEGDRAGDVALSHAPRVVLVGPNSRPERRLRRDRRFRVLARDANAVLYVRMPR
jgi:hypothetical protein